MVQHEQQGALDVHVSGPFDLEAVSLLSGRHSVPLRARKQKTYSFIHDE